MSNRIALKQNFAKKVALMTAGMVTLAAPVIVGIVNAPAILAQSNPQQSQTTPAGKTGEGFAVSFEVASVKPGDRRASTDGLKSEDGTARGPNLQLEHRRFTATNFNLFGLIVKAYGVVGCRPLGAEACALVSGGPDWLRKDGFDIAAKAPDDSPDYTFIQLMNGVAPQLQLMLQALLADRFHLKLHREKRQLPVFALTVARNGPKFKKAEESEEHQLVFREPAQPNGQTMIRLIGKNSSMQELVELYSKFMDHPMLDKTGLKDRYDFTVEYEPNTDETGPFAKLTGPALYKALQEQAGLKLEATRGLVDVLVIDHAERPSGN